MERDNNTTELIGKKYYYGCQFLKQTKKGIVKKIFTLKAKNLRCRMMFKSPIPFKTKVNNE